MSQRQSILEYQLVFKSRSLEIDNSGQTKTNLGNSTKGRSDSEALVNSEIQNSDLELTSELIKKASILKNNSINFSNILTREDANLKEISFKLENQTIIHLNFSSF